MKGETPFQEVSAEQLRDHAQPERVDRIWRRIEEDLTPRARSRRRALTPWIWVPAAVGCVFGAGVLVGAHWFPVEPPMSATVMPEPTPVSEPASAPATASRVLVEPQRAPSLRRVRPSQPTPAQTVEPETSPVVEPIALEPAIPPPVVVTGPPGWQLLVEDERYPEALASIQSAGGLEAVLRQANAEQLMLLGDLARFAKRRDLFSLALQRVVNEYSTDPSAPEAALMLGNELLTAGDQGGAAQAFAMYRALSPKGDFAEDALKREFEIAVGQGNLEHARKLADQYAKDFPEGPHLAEIRAGLDAAHKRRATGEGAAGASVQSSATQSSTPASGGSK